VHVRGVSTDCKVLWRSIRRSDSHFVTKTGLDSVVVSFDTKGMFGYAFEGSKRAFNNQKICLKKKVFV
jgi:hypothetical protein